MAVYVNGKSANRGRRNVRAVLKEKGGQLRVSRELARQRKALGAAGQARTMKNWRIRPTTAADRKAGKAARGQKFTGAGRNG